MSELQLQVHDIRQRIAANIEAYPTLQPVLDVLTCPECSWPEQLLCETSNCAACNHTGTRDISDWPDGALSGVIKHIANKGFGEASRGSPLFPNKAADVWLDLFDAIDDVWDEKNPDSASLAALTRMLDELGVPALPASEVQS